MVVYILEFTKEEDKILHEIKVGKGLFRLCDV